LVIIERGELTIATSSSEGRRFRCGAVLWLTAGLVVQNDGPSSVVMIAISRRDDATGDGR
jgi:hypothetical protein